MDRADNSDSYPPELSTTKRKRDKTETDNVNMDIDKGNASPIKRTKSSTPLVDQQAEEDEKARLNNEELPHAGLAASSHQSIGVVQ